MKLKLLSDWCEHKKGDILDVDQITYEALVGHRQIAIKAPIKPEKNKMQKRNKVKNK